MVTVIVMPSTTISVSVGISVVAVTMTMEDPGANMAEEEMELLVEVGTTLVDVGAIYG